MSNYFKHKMRGKSPFQIAGAIVLMVLGGIGLAILFGFIIMWLWNWIMPELFGLPMVTYWQGIGLFILSKILLGGCNFGNGNSSKKEKKECEGKKSKSNFSKWEHYDDFWKEEGDDAFQKYFEKKEANNSTKSDE